MYLPIAAEAEAATRAAAELPPAPRDEQPATPDNLPAKAAPGGAVQRRANHTGSLIPTIPTVTRAAARWIRPLVPPLVARAIDTTTHPLRTAREVFEEVEEITFSLKRTGKVTFNTEQGTASPRQPYVAAVQTNSSQRVDPASVTSDPDELGASIEDRPSIGHHARGALIGGKRPFELRGPNDPRELPPAR
jgi:hypothetical protein